VTFGATIEELYLMSQNNNLDEKIQNYKEIEQCLTCILVRTLDSLGVRFTDYVGGHLYSSVLPHA